MSTLTRGMTATVMIVLSLCMMPGPNAQGQEPFGWRVGPTAWTFNRFSLFEAIDKTASVGMTCIEAFEGQTLMPGAEAKLDAGLGDDLIQQLRTKLDQAKVRLVSVYIHDIPGEEAGCRRIFEFARKLGVLVIISEPASEALDVIEACCNEYGISLAIHNHPEGSSRYWNPEEVLRVCQGRGPRIGACGDTGHWLRSGLNPVESFRILGNRLLTVHLKDLNAASKEAHDVPWGEGCGDLENVLRVLREMRIKPVLFGIEYESEWENNLPRVEACGKWFAETVNRLAAETNREDPLFVGWASREITPPQPVALVGQYHTRISQGVLDPLTATALAMETQGPEGKNEQAVFVACDICFVERPVIERLREVLKSRVPELDPRKVVVHATHTHDGPGLQDSSFEGVYDTSGHPEVMTASQYGEFFIGQVADAVVEAWEKRAPAGMSWALGCAAVGINRRVQYFDGSTVMYGDTSRDDFQSFEGSADPGLPLLFFFTLEKALTGIVVNLPCPSQETESLMQVSADFWHEIRQELRRRHGEGLFVLAQCAAAGDVSPHRVFRKAAEEAMLQRKGISRRQEIANRIANAVDEVLPGALPEIRFALPLRHVILDLDLPEKDPPLPPFVKTDSVHPAEFHVLRIGDVAMATNPFELYQDYGLRIQARTRAVLTLPVQLAGGQSGYLPTAEGVRGGGYSAENYLVTPDGGQVIVNETVAALNALWP